MVRAGRFLVVADLTPPPRHLSLITMHRTIFTTPVVNTALRGLSLAYLRAKGRLRAACPLTPKNAC
jgi:hypothetical protein